MGWLLMPFPISQSDDVGTLSIAAIVQARSQLGCRKSVITSRLVPYSLLCPHLKAADTFGCGGSPSTTLQSNFYQSKRQVSSSD